ncbi:MAG: RecX family transcriptional regulator, partial [Proteobacteria bacterium]|nr:RecX family transcriptional regulator [Pseudomonadota bacterium]
MQAGLTRGREIGDDELACLLDADSVEKAYDRALTFLSFRPRSTAEVRKSLQERKTSPEVIDQVVERLRAGGLLDDAAFAQMKPGVHLVNVARGALVDHEALRGALGDGRVGLASLDCVDPEPLPAGHWLYTHPRVRLSPHTSWSMPGAFDLLIEPFLENLRRALRGEPLIHLVDLELGY